MACTTRKRIIESARKLFASKGIEHTSMLDVAEETKISRRTLYSYFSSKGELQHALIKEDSDLIVGNVLKIKNNPSLTATEKLRTLANERLNLLKQRTLGKHGRHGLNEIWDGTHLNSASRMAADRELEILQEILREGELTGEFNPQKTELLKPTLLLVMRGASVRGIEKFLTEFATDAEQCFNDAVDFLMLSIGYNEEPRPMHPQIK